MDFIYDEIEGTRALWTSRLAFTACFAVWTIFSIIGLIVAGRDRDAVQRRPLTGCEGAASGGFIATHRARLADSGPRDILRGLERSWPGRLTTA